MAYDYHLRAEQADFRKRPEKCPTVGRSSLPTKSSKRPEMRDDLVHGHAPARIMTTNRSRPRRPASSRA